MALVSWVLTKRTSLSLVGEYFVKYSGSITLVLAATVTILPSGPATLTAVVAGLYNSVSLFMPVRDGLQFGRGFLNVF